ncbi:DgyrCDS1684 [Dimorphilus gyrociliatus]|uniref:DgyrCDS1684 n=1 Tax=Dimorphilus gyrociliatus TaxID=2664684 RepID=A0A7I8VA65_9ANNE|nr:DgyrCDS1684 [Dimorphilus gyrociliatus]
MFPSVNQFIFTVEIATTSSKKISIFVYLNVGLAIRQSLMGDEQNGTNAEQPFLSEKIVEGHPLIIRFDAAYAKSCIGIVHLFISNAIVFGLVSFISFFSSSLVASAITFYTNFDQKRIPRTTIHHLAAAAIAGYGYTILLACATFHGVLRWRQSTPATPS